MPRSRATACPACRGRPPLARCRTASARGRLSYQLAVCAMLAAFAHSAQAAASSRMLIEFQGPPTAHSMPADARMTGASNLRMSAASTAADVVREEHQQFRLAAAGVAMTEHHAFHHVFNGMSVELEGSPQQRSQAMERLQALPQVKSVRPVVVYHKHSQRRDAAAQPSNGGSRRSRQLLSAALAPPQATKLYNGNATRAYNVNKELGVTGKGVAVGVIDTGVDYLHPDLGGGFGTGFRVSKGYDFVGDKGTVGSDGTINFFPGPDPRDTCDGHGTHVAGLVGANGAVVGMAPNVTLGAYRIFSCDGSNTDDVILAAADRALADGMDIINLSLGSGPTWPTQGPQAALNAALNNLALAGLVVVVSAGNDGGLGSTSLGMYGISSPAVAPATIAVAACEDSTVAVHDATLNPGNILVTYVRSSETENIFPANTPLTLQPSFQYTYSGGKPTTLPTADACAAAFINPLVYGNVAFIRRGGCNLVTKVTNALSKGATGVVMYNHIPLESSRVITPDTTHGAAMLSYSDGAKVLAAFAAGNGAMMTFYNDTARRIQAPSYGAVTDFSSYGPTFALTFKPDIAAPGELIVSTYPLPLGGYYADAGTSMSAPELAGCAALLIDALPGFPVANIKGLLQNTAVPQVYIDLGTAQKTALPAPVHIQGAGKVDIYAAVTSNALVTPSAIALGAGSGARTQKITVFNADTRTVSLKISHQPALAERWSTVQSQQTIVQANPVVTLSTTRLTVKANGEATFTATIRPPSAGLPNLGLYGGFIVLTGAASPLRVPYFGLKGNYQTLDPISYVSFGYDPSELSSDPYTTKYHVTRPNAELQALRNGSWQGDSFNFVDRFPAFSVSLLHGARAITAVLIDLDSGFTKQFINEQYPVAASDVSVYSYQVPQVLGNPGSYPPGYVKFAAGDPDNQCVLPNGHYRVLLKVYKALGTDKDYVAFSQRFKAAHPGYRPAGTKFCNPHSKKTTPRPVAATGQRVAPVPTTAALAPTSIIKPTK